MEQAGVEVQALSKLCCIVTNLLVVAACCISCQPGIVTFGVVVGSGCRCGSRSTSRGVFRPGADLPAEAGPKMRGMTGYDGRYSKAGL